MTATNLPATYRVRITLGDGVTTPQVSYTVDSTDSFDGTDPSQVLDGLRLGWSMPSGAPWPSQPDPLFCSLGLLAKVAADLEVVAAEGTPVEVIVTDTPGGGGATIATFYGRVASSSAVAVRRPSGNRTLFTLSCVDYGVDWVETIVEFSAITGSVGPPPLVSIKDYLDVVVADIADQEHVTIVNTLTSPPGNDFAAPIPARTGSVYATITDALRQHNPDMAGGWRRYYLFPRSAPGAMAPLAPEIRFYENRINSVDLPGLLAVSGGVLGLTLPASISGDVARGVIDGCQVAFDSVAWRNDKRRSPTRLTITGPFDSGYGGPVRASTGAARAVKLEVSTDFNSAILPADAINWGPGRLANMYLPASATETNGWEVVSFRAHAFELLSQIREWFPDHGSAATTTWPIQPVVVTDVPDELNLAGPTGRYAGQLSAATLTIARGRIAVEFSLRRRLSDPIGNQTKTASYDYVEATFPTIDYDHVDAALSYYDTSLARKA